MALNLDPTSAGASLSALAEAYDLAADIGREPWDFAVDLRELRLAGTTSAALRWLCCKEYAELATEVTAPSEEARSFKRHGAFSFNRRTCAVLTGIRRAFARELSIGSNSDDRTYPCAGVRGPQRLLPTPGSIPHWDADRQELRFDGRVIKRFRATAPNQELILAVFEEEGWPPRIDDPLPPEPEQDSRRRLLDTIKCLNRNHHKSIIRFRGDGTGRGVRWDMVEDVPKLARHVLNGSA